MKAADFVAIVKGYLEDYESATRKDPLVDIWEEGLEFADWAEDFRLYVFRRTEEDMRGWEFPS